jgi:hypothetical protein
MTDPLIPLSGPSGARERAGTEPGRRRGGRRAIAGLLTGLLLLVGLPAVGTEQAVSPDRTSAREVMASPLQSDRPPGSGHHSGPERCVG